jgi:hypothetical protein
VTHISLVQQLEQPSLLHGPGHVDLLQQLAPGIVGPQLGGLGLDIPQHQFQSAQRPLNAPDVTKALTTLSAGHFSSCP